jgi:hypothetical protein
MLYFILGVVIVVLGYAIYLGDSILKTLSELCSEVKSIRQEVQRPHLEERRRAAELSEVPSSEESKAKLIG